MSEQAGTYVQYEDKNGKMVDSNGKRTTKIKDSNGNMTIKTDCAVASRPGQIDVMLPKEGFADESMALLFAKLTKKRSN